MEERKYGREGKKKESTLEEEPAWSKHAQQDFGRGSAGQTWEVLERREVWNKEMQEGKEVH